MTLFIIGTGIIFLGPAILVVKDGKNGITDYHGNILVPIIYDRLYPQTNTRLAAEIGNMHGIITFGNKTYFHFGSGEILPKYAKEVYIAMDTSGKWSAFDSTGRLSGEYEKMEYCNDSCILIWKEGKWGAINRKGEMLLPTIYDSVVYYGVGGDYIKLQQNKKWGLATMAGTLKVPCDYEDIIYIDEKKFAAKLKGKWNIVSDKGVHQVPGHYWDFGASGSDEIVWARWGWNYSYINLYGKEVIPLKVRERPRYFHNDTVRLSNGPNVYADVKGNIFRKPATSYKSVGGFSDGRAVVFDNEGYYGFINRRGQPVIPTQYQDARQFNSGLAAVRWDGKYGYIDTNGKVIIEFIYDKAYDFHEGLAAVDKLGKYGYIDKRGRTVIPFKYENADAFRDGMACVAEDDLYGMIDKKGEMVLPLSYDYSFWFSEGLAAVSQRHKIFFIDTAGNTVIKDTFDYFDFNGLQAKADNDNDMSLSYGIGGNGYINKAGKLITSKTEFRRSYFMHGLTTALLFPKTGYSTIERHAVIDRNGKMVVPFIYNWISGFDKNGIAIVEQYERYALMDTTGKLITPFSFEDVGYSDEIGEIFDHPLIATKIKGKWGYSNYLGQTIIPHKYDKATHFSEGLAAVQLGDNWGYIDETGKEVIWLEFPKSK